MHRGGWDGGHTGGGLEAAEPAGGLVARRGGAHRGPGPASMTPEEGGPAYPWVDVFTPLGPEEGGPASRRLGPRPCREDRKAAGCRIRAALPARAQIKPEDYWL